MSESKDVVRVKILYRNYKPIHKIYESIIEFPPQGVVYTVPPVKSNLSKLVPIYRRYRENVVVKAGIRLLNKFVFSGSNSKDEHIDLYHCINILPNNPNGLSAPFLVELEHISSLTGFMKDDAIFNKTKETLRHPKCAGIICISKAARETVRKAMGRDWEELEKKVHVVYPAIKPPARIREDDSIIGDKNVLNLLFVGNESNRKGLPDLLEAVRRINATYGHQKLSLFIVSSDAKTIVEKNNLPNVKLFKPNFSKEEILRKFFLPADLFILPTRLDTFGLVIVDSLAAGTPVVATKQFAIPEIIDDGNDGYLIAIEKAPLDTYLFVPRKSRKEYESSSFNEKKVVELKGIIKKIVDDRTLLEQLSMNARKKFIGNGKFSITHRNSQLQKIYKDVIKTYTTPSN